MELLILVETTNIHTLKVEVLISNIDTNHFK